MRASTTSTPSAASRIAIARPMPDDDPVTMALRMLISPTFLFLYCRDARLFIRGSLPAQPELEDRRRRPLPRRLLAAGRRAAGARLAHRADALPGAGGHPPATRLGRAGAVAPPR